jgi:hypothetical protein
VGGFLIEQGSKWILWGKAENKKNEKNCRNPKIGHQKQEARKEEGECLKCV